MTLEEVFDETVEAGTTSQEELELAILLRCAGGQLKSYLNLTIGDNVQYPALRGNKCWNGIVLSRSGLLPWWQVAVQTVKDPRQWTLVEPKVPKEKVTRARMTS